MTLKQASSKRWVQRAEIQLPASLLGEELSYEGLRVINQQLWCCSGDAGIVVFDSELQQQRTIQAGDVGYVHDVAEMSNGDIVITARTGLYHSSNGKCSNCL